MKAKFGMKGGLMMLMVMMVSSVFAQENKDSAVVHANHAIIYEQAEDYDLAVEEYSIAISFDSEDAVLYDKRGVCYTKLEKYHKALADFNKSLMLLPENLDSYNHRGIVFMLLKKYNKALSDFDEVIKSDPEYAKAYFNRGLVKFAINDEKGLNEDMAKAASLNNKKAIDFMKEIGLCQN